jgi:hypothetical protein
MLVASIKIFTLRLGEFSCDIAISPWFPGATELFLKIEAEAEDLF